VVLFRNTVTNPLLTAEAQRSQREFFSDPIPPGALRLDQKLHPFGIKIHFLMMAIALISSLALKEQESFYLAVSPRQKKLFSAFSATLR
jgi:hypothetical protein